MNRAHRLPRKNAVSKLIVVVGIVNPPHQPCYPPQRLFVIKAIAGIDEVEDGVTPDKPFDPVHDDEVVAVSRVDSGA